MQQWPEPRSPWGLLNTVADLVRERGHGDRVLGQLSLRERGAVELPGYSLLGWVGGTPALSRILDLEQFTDEDLVWAYEAFAGRVPRAAEVPDFTVARYFPRQRQWTSLFSRRRDCRCWFSTVALLVGALAAKVEQQAGLDGALVLFQYQGYNFTAGSLGIWSSRNERYMKQRGGPLASDAADLAVPPLQTSHPLAQALVAAGLDEDTLALAAMALRSGEVQAAGVETSTQHFSRRLGKPPQIGRPVGWRKQRYADREAALLALARAQAILNENRKGGAQELAITLVPVVMTSREFQRIVGPTVMAREERFSRATQLRLLMLCKKLELETEMGA